MGYNNFFRTGFSCGVAQIGTTLALPVGILVDGGGGHTKSTVADGTGGAAGRLCCCKGMKSANEAGVNTWAGLVHDSGGGGDAEKEAVAKSNYKTLHEAGRNQGPWLTDNRKQMFEQDRHR